MKSKLIEEYADFYIKKMPVLSRDYDGCYPFL